MEASPIPDINALGDYLGNHCRIIEGEHFKTKSNLGICLRPTPIWSLP